MLVSNAPDLKLLHDPLELGMRPHVTPTQALVEVEIVPSVHYLHEPVVGQDIEAEAGIVSG